MSSQLLVVLVITHIVAYALGADRNCCGGDS